jgi:hypothetical protein
MILSAKLVLKTNYALLVTIFSMLIEDLSLIFGVFACTYEALNDCLLPSIILLFAYRYKRMDNPLSKLAVILFFGFGMVYVVIGTYYNFKKMKINI